MVQIISKRLNQEIGTADTRPTPEQLVVLLRRFIEDAGGRFTVSYETVLADTNTAHYAVRCTIRDNETQIEMTRVGEKQDCLTEHPVADTYDDALCRTAGALLQVSYRKVKDPQALNDNTVLLFGNMTGMCYGDVKTTEQFRHFLEQLAQTDDLQFADEERNQQIKQLRALWEKEYGKGKASED